MRGPGWLLLLVGLATGTSACKPHLSNLDAGHIIKDFDACGAPPAPMLDSLPASTPYPIVTLRGNASQAARIIVDGTANPLEKDVLQGNDSSFCVDVPLSKAGQDYNFQVFSQNGCGLLSATGTMATVTYDPSAPPIQNCTTCNGASCAGIMPPSDAGVGCVDDGLEPNDTPMTAPRVTPGRYNNLKICPDNPDFYGILAHDGQTIIAHIYFIDAMGDLDMKLFDTDGTTMLAESTTATDDEMIMYTVSTGASDGGAGGGVYWLNVYGFSGATNTYALDVQVM